MKKFRVQNKKCEKKFSTNFLLEKKVVLKSSEAYAKKILPSALFEGGESSADRYLGQGSQKL